MALLQSAYGSVKYLKAAQINQFSLLKEKAKIATNRPIQVYNNY